MWVGTFAGGLYQFREHNGVWAAQKNLTEADGLAADQIRSILVRRNGEIWLGTRFSGISIYKDNRFRNISRKDGLLNNAVWALAEDADARVWIGTSVGIQYIEPGDSLRFFSHTRLTGRFVNALGFSPDQGSMWSTSSSELLIYEFEKEKRVTPPPPVYITHFRVNGEERELKSGLELTHDEN